MTLGDSSLAYLGEGIVDLLSAKLRGRERGSVVDPAIVLRAWRADAAGDSGGEESARTIARRVGAGWVISGTVVGDASRLILQAALLSAETGERRAYVEVEGSSTDLVGLVDRVAVRLLALREGEGDGERLDEITSTSPAAVRAFLYGQAAFRRGDYQAAVAAYDEALRHDSTFALAALHLALAADRSNDAEQHDRALAIAWRLRAELSRLDNAVLTAFAGPRYPWPSPDQEQVDAWEQVVALAPDLGYAWLELGERYFHNGAVLGLADAHLRAAAALRRALQLDSTSVRARTLLALLAAREGDSTRLARLRVVGIGDSSSAYAPVVQWRVALALADTRTLRSMRLQIPGLSQASLRLLGMLALYDGVGVQDGARAVRLMAARAAPGASQLDALLAEHAVALNQGRPILALDVTEQLQEAFPLSHPHLRLRVLDGLYGSGDMRAAAQAADSLRVLTGRRAGRSPPGALWLADLCVLAQWDVARGRLRDVPTMLGELNGGEVSRIPVPVGGNPFACASVVAAQLAVRSREPDAERAVRALDSLALGGPAVSDVATYAPIVVARLYRELGDLPSALAAIQRRGYMNGWPRYLATMRYLEGTLALALGDSARALRTLERYLAWRSAPERTLRVEVDSVQRLVRLLRSRQQG
jgi:tetratricopeptide (TPR) repeat protein